MYDVYRQMRANVNPQIGKQTFDQNMSEYLRSAEEHRNYFFPFKPYID